MVEELIRKYINQVNIMQLATSANDQPWVVIVHYYADLDFNLYWTSRPDRRHSKEIAANPKTSATILIHENTANENWVIGLTASGESELVNNMEDKISQAYVSKLHKDPNLPANIATGKDLANWYVLRASNIILFDSKDFPTNPRQDYKIRTTNE